MPIVTLQRQFRELGRIRLGATEPTQNGKRRPTKLSTWRLTSSDRSAIERAAEVFRGRAVPWADAPAGTGPQWEVVTEATELPILVPPGQTLTQWYELWTGGGCIRRCDGVTEQLSGKPCLCPSASAERMEAAADGNACKPTTRLSVILPDLPDFGTWRLESHGYYAAIELGGSAELLAAATAAGVPLRATLWIDWRTKRRPGKAVLKWATPAIRIAETPAEILAPALAAGTIDPTALRLAAGTLRKDRGRPALPAGPALPERSDFGPPAGALVGEVVDGSGLDERLFTRLALNASVGKLRLADELSAFLDRHVSPDDVSAEVRALSGDDRGRLADALGLPWRSADSPASAAGVGQSATGDGRAVLASAEASPRASVAPRRANGEVRP